MIFLAGVLSAWAGPAEEGDAAFRAGRMADAEADYTRALAAKPDDVVALIGRGRARHNLHRDGRHGLRSRPQGGPAHHT
jgi:Flp pilus assembly protein TadD